MATDVLDIKAIEDALDAKLAGFREELGKASTELKDAINQEVDDKMKKGFIDPETKERNVRLEEKIRKIEAQMLAPDSGGGAFRRNWKSAGEQLTEDEGFVKWAEEGFHVRSGRRFHAVALKGGAFPESLERKLISVDGLGSGTSGVFMPDRLPGIQQLERRDLRIRDIMRVMRLTQGNSIDYLKQNVFTNLASPQVEGAAKSESSLTYTVASAVVRTIAHWIQVTTQALADLPGLREDIDSIMMYGLKLKEEAEILAGDGTGVHLDGLINQATAYNTAYNVANDTKLDKIRHAILQARLALYPVDAIVLNPRDLHDMELIKDDYSGTANTGRYILGDPRTGQAIPTLWGKPVVESDSMTYGTFLVGAFRVGAILIDRMQASIDISFEHGTNFTENEATIRAEERIGLAVTRPLSFTYGSF